MYELPCRECDRVEFLMDMAGGAISGGTVASLFGAVFDESGPDSKAVSDPYGLDPPNSDRGPDKSDKFWGGYNKHLDAWYMPFVMGPINSRVVRRSNALMDYRYGELVEISPSVCKHISGNKRSQNRAFSPKAELGFNILLCILQLNTHSVAGTIMGSTLTCVKSPPRKSIAQQILCLHH